MIFYFLIFFAFVSIGIIKNHYNLESKFVLPAAAIILIFFSAFRGPYVDKDYQNYLDSFSQVLGPLDYFKNMSDWFFYEPFFYLIPSTLKAVGLPHYELLVFFIFAATAVTITIINIHRISNFPVLSIITWFSFYFLLHEMTQIRAAVAAGFLIMCLYNHYHQNYFKFFLNFFISLMFHYTSLLILPVLFLNSKKFNLKINLSLLVIALLLAFLHSDLFIRPVFLIDAPFVKKLTVTLQAFNEENNVINFYNPVFITQVLITVWLFINHKKLNENNRYAYLLLKLQLIGIFAMCTFSSIAVIAFRISEFYGVVSIVSMPLLMYTFTQRLYGYIAVVAYAFFMLIIFVVRQQLVGPYNLVFFNNSFY